MILVIASMNFVLVCHFGLKPFRSNFRKKFKIINALIAFTIIFSLPLVYLKLDKYENYVTYLLIIHIIISFVTVIKGEDEPIDIY